MTAATYFKKRSTVSFSAQQAVGMKRLQQTTSLSASVRNSRVTPLLISTREKSQRLDKCTVDVWEINPGGVWQAFHTATLPSQDILSFYSHQANTHQSTSLSGPQKPFLTVWSCLQMPPRRWCLMAPASVTIHTPVVWTFSACRHLHSAAGRSGKIAARIFIFTQHECHERKK